jgi:hypothetical protein
LKKEILAVAVILIIAAAGVGYFYYRAVVNSKSTKYITSFSQVQLRQIPLQSADCAGSECTTTLDVSIPFLANTGSESVAYYANLILLSNPSNTPHVIHSITAYNVGGDVSEVGRITIYYFASQSDFNTDGTPAGTPPGSCVITGPLGCKVFSGTQTVAALGGHYLEVIAYANAGASKGTVSLTFSVDWS